MCGRKIGAIVCPNPNHVARVYKVAGHGKPRCAGGGLTATDVQE